MEVAASVAAGWADPDAWTLRGTKAYQSGLLLAAGVSANVGVWVGKPMIAPTVSLRSLSLPTAQPAHGAVSGG